MAKAKRRPKSSNFRSDLRNYLISQHNDWPMNITLTKAREDLHMAVAELSWRLFERMKAKNEGAKGQGGGATGGKGPGDIPP